MTGAARSIRLLPSLSRTDLDSLAQAATPSYARIAPGHEPNGRLRYLWTDRLPAIFAEVDPASVACGPVDLVALPEVELGTDWTPYLDGGALVDETLYPIYVRQYYETGSIDLFGYPKVRRVRRIGAPVYVVTHFNMRTYGHFLLEVLPKCMLISALYRRGLSYRVAFPASLSGFLRIIRAACPELRFFIYDDRRERLSIKLALLPTSLVSPSSHLHELAVAGFKTLNVEMNGDVGRERRLFLSRQGVRSFRTLTNETELAAVAGEYGFETVRPETLPWSRQVRLFASATHVIGEFSSALHNTLFSSPSTKVVTLNWWASVQSAIATSVGHEVGYIMPRGGNLTQFRNGWTETQPFEIDPDLLRERLEQIGLRRTAA